MKGCCGRGEGSQCGDQPCVSGGCVIGCKKERQSQHPTVERGGVGDSGALKLEKARIQKHRSLPRGTYKEKKKRAPIESPKAE